MIKSIRVTIVLTLLVVGMVFAQDLKKEEQRIIISDTIHVVYESKSRPALAYEVDTDVKSLKKHWSKFLKTSYKAKFKTEEKKFWATKDLVVNSISDKRLNLIVGVTEKVSSSLVSFSAAFGYDIYIDEHSYAKEFNELRLLAEKFLLASSKEYYTSTIKKFDKEISDLEKDNLKLNKKNLENNKLIKSGDDQLLVLNNSKSEDTENSVKVLKKISKITKKQVSYKARIVENKREIEANNIKIQDFKKSIALKLAKQKLLQH